MPKIDKSAVYRSIFGGDTSQEKAILIAELEQEKDNPFITIRLTKSQIKKMSEYVALLPKREFRALTLWYCARYTVKKLQKAVKEEKVMGLIRYLKDRLTQCMGLPRPIAERYWYYACSKAMDIYDFTDRESE